MWTYFLVVNKRCPECHVTIQHKTKYQVALANISNSNLPTAQPNDFPLLLEQVQTFHAQIYCKKKRTT
jgi:hypothetical protein